MVATFLAAAGTLLTFMVAQPSIDTGVSEQYVKLVLALGEHDRDYVDAYYGPPEWRAEVKASKLDLHTIDGRAAELLRRLASSTPPASADELTRLRHAYVTRQLDALRARIAMLSGKKF